LFNQLSLYCGGAAQYKLLVKVCVGHMTKIWHSRPSSKQVDRRPATMANSFNHKTYATIILQLLYCTKGVLGVFLPSFNCFP